MTAQRPHPRAAQRSELEKTLEEVVLPTCPTSKWMLIVSIHLRQADLAQGTLSTRSSIAIQRWAKTFETLLPHTQANQLPEFKESTWMLTITLYSYCLLYTSDAA